jgi:hypothetical protein
MAGRAASMAAEGAPRGLLAQRREIWCREAQGDLVEGGPRADEHEQPGGDDMCDYEAELSGLPLSFFTSCRRSLQRKR